MVYSIYFKRMTVLLNLFEMRFKIAEFLEYKNLRRPTLKSSIYLSYVNVVTVCCFPFLIINIIASHFSNFQADFSFSLWCSLSCSRELINCFAHGKRARIISFFFQFLFPIYYVIFLSIQGGLNGCLFDQRP